MIAVHMLIAWRRVSVPTEKESIFYFHQILWMTNASPT
jgi:hypothetical protein